MVNPRTLGPLAKSYTEKAGLPDSDRFQVDSRSHQASLGLQ